MAHRSAQLDRFTDRLAHLVGADTASADALRRLGRDRLDRLAEDAAKQVADIIAWEALGPILTGQQVLERCVELTSLEAVDEANINGHLVEVRDGRGEPLGYPAFQLRHGELLPGLLEVLEAFWDERVTVDRWLICRWLTSPEDALDGLSPVECLRRAGGVSPAVMRCVMAFRAQTLWDEAGTPPDSTALSWAIPAPG